MKVSSEGRIAYHSLRFNERGGTDLVQYDFDGSVESITTCRPAIDHAAFEREWYEKLNWLQKLFYNLAP